MINKITVQTNKSVKLLGDVVNFLDHLRKPITASERKDGSYPYYGANGQQGMIDDYIFNESLILLAEDGGHFGNPDKTIAYIVEGKTWVNNHAHVLQPRKGTDINFLRRHLEYYDVRPFINGATRSKLTKTSAAKIPLFFPPLPEQKRIATILDKANALRQKRQESLLLADDLLRSSFLEMFGEQSRNKCNWDESYLGDMVEFMTSGSRGWAKYYSSAGEIFLRIQNVGKNKLLTNDICFITPPDSAEAKRTKVRANDILLTITADLGRTAVIPESYPTAYINQHLAILRLKKGINPYYISEFISSCEGKSQIAKLNKGGVKAGLNFNDIKSIKIPLPPKTLQDKFSKIYDKISTLEGRYITSMQEMNNQFNSLSQKAFRGEL